MPNSYNRKSILINYNNKEIALDGSYRTLFEYNPDIVFFIDTEGIIVEANKLFSEILGYTLDEVLLGSMKRFLPSSKIPLLRESFNKVLSGETQNMDTVFLHKNGNHVQINLTVIPAKNNGDVMGVFGIAKDITDLKKVEDLNRYLSYHDPLTGLPNRKFFEEKLEQELIISKTLQQKLAVIYLDLDRFKNINTTLGNSIGDKLLEQVSRRLKSFIKDKETLARMAGDECAVLLPNIHDTDSIIDYSKKIIQLLEDPFVVEDYKLYVTAGIGISIYPSNGEDSQTLMKHADSALFKAKEKGRNTYQIYNSSMDVYTYKTLTLESDLRNAIELNQLDLYYQPKVSAVSNQIVGAEALIRWHHPEWGLLTPKEFIPLAEESGLIVEIGKWTKRTACAQNKAWQTAGLPAIPISVNLFAKRFLQMDLVDHINDILKETNLNPQDLEIEITETSLLENEKVVLSILDKIRNMGIKVSLDDFGTGYSSLSYLNRFKGKIDTLKIDHSFINNLSIVDQDNNNFITNTIIQLAQHLNMKVVAEGVETKEQLNILREYKCDTIQGYLFSKPVPADDFANLLRKGKLEAIEDDKIDGTTVSEDLRNYFRINLDFPLLASMTLIQIQGRKVELGKTNVLIEDIGLGGLRFLSDIKLAVHRGILLEFETEILGSTIKVCGAIVWLKEVQQGIFQYGIEFSIDENHRTILARLLNKFSLLHRKNPLVPDCSFVKVDRFNFFKNTSEE